MTSIQPKPLVSRTSNGLAGNITVPGDKSISHRTLMLGAVAVGHTIVSGLLEAEDVLNTARAMAALGARVERHRDGKWHIHGCGVGGFVQPAGIIDFGNSGTGARLCAGLVATTPITTSLSGDASLRSRPMTRITTPLALFGARFDTRDGGRLPMRIHGAAHPVPVEYRLPVASAQVKSAVLLAALNTPGRSCVIERIPTRDHTEKMLAAFGARLEIENRAGETHICLEGCHELCGQNVTVPADPSSAAFPVVAALITRDSNLTIENVMLNPSRTGLIKTLKEMGAKISISNRKHSGGEETGDITVESSDLAGVTVPPERAASMIDEYPVLAIAAAFAKGMTRMEGVGELRVKESDRLAAVRSGLEANGVKVRTGDDWMEIDGTGSVEGGGTVHSGLDHRIAMAFVVMGLASKNPVTIDDSRPIATSFPGFEDLMKKTGCRLESGNSVS